MAEYGWLHDSSRCNPISRNDSRYRLLSLHSNILILYTSEPGCAVLCSLLCNCNLSPSPQLMSLLHGYLQPFQSGYDSCQTNSSAWVYGNAGLSASTSVVHRTSDGASCSPLPIFDCDDHSESFPSEATGIKLLGLCWALFMSLEQQDGPCLRVVVDMGDCRKHNDMCSLQ